MKKPIVLFVALMMSACTTTTPHGECIGLNGDENPMLKYKYSAWNIGVGILFSSLIIPPIVVALDGLKCPVGAK